MINKELKPIIEQSFAQYAGAVIQSRALVDVRDGLKPSARQIFYSMLQHKLTHKNPYKKTANAVGMAMADFYIHGDSSCEGVIMRAGQGFAMRYPLVDVKGNAGTLIESGNWAAMRYTESRLSSISDILFADIDKETISEWRDNYDNTKQFPAVLPSKGYYNICNGTQGIATGMASSVPQYNLRELNNALIYLIDHPDCNFDDIYCAPDFATGAILYNENEVKESMKNGTGFACKLRSIVEFDAKERCFIVTEIPYGVYTNTICSELEEIVNGENNPGIERFNDLTGEKPLIKIYLSKKANPDKVLKFLYKETSLQYYYSINFTMLDNGRFPRVFTWKEMLQAHIDHEKIVYRKGFEFDLAKIEKRIHIIDGLLICLANIDEVVKVIKTSSSTATASTALQSNFLLDEEQAKAVLDMKLNRLAHLEVEKLKNEKVSLEKEASRLIFILNDINEFNQQLINGWREVANKFGDNRRTKILNLNQNEDEPTEIKSLQLNLTNKNNLFVSEVSTLYTQRRGTVGKKIKLDNGEFILSTLPIESNDTVIFFSKNGNYYGCSGDKFVIDEKTPIESIINTSEHICAMSSVASKSNAPYLLFFTKKGLIKKTDRAEYNPKRVTGTHAISLEPGDTIVSVISATDERVGILTNGGNFVIIDTKDVRSIGRVAKGIKAIKLNDEDEVVAVKIINSNDKEIASISGNGLIKRTSISEFNVQGKNTKGAKLQKLTTADWMADFLPLTNDQEVLVASTTACLKISVDTIPQLSKGAQGVKAMKLSGKDNIIGISKC